MANRLTLPGHDSSVELQVKPLDTTMFLFPIIFAR